MSKNQSISPVAPECASTWGFCLRSGHRLFKRPPPQGKFLAIIPGQSGIATDRDRLPSLLAKRPMMGRLRALALPRVGLFCLLVSPGTLKATSLVNETFTGDTAAGWTLTSTQGAGPSLTSGGVDPTNQGWLRLTNDTTNQNSFVYYNTPIASTGGLAFNFDFAVWTTARRDAGDGFTLAIFEPTATPGPGGYGGSLGYAQRTNINGLSNAIVGIGFDSFGNFSAATEGREEGPGRRRNSIAVRGPMGADRQSGYEFI